MFGEFKMKIGIRLTTGLPDLADEYLKRRHLGFGRTYRKLMPHYGTDDEGNPYYNVSYWIDNIYNPDRPIVIP